MSRVVILGAGISGHTAAAFARKWLTKNDTVTVVSPLEYYNWIPSNIWVGVGLVRPAPGEHLRRRDRVRPAARDLTSAHQPNGTVIAPAPPRTGMPSAEIGKTVARSIAGMVRGSGQPTSTASMAEMGAACVTSAGAHLLTGTAASTTVYPIVPDSRATRCTAATWTTRSAR